MTLQEVGLIVVAIIVLALGWALAEELSADNWARARQLWQRFVMSRSDDVDALEELALNDPIPATTTTLQNDNNAIAITQPERNALLLEARADALAALVLAEKVTETEGIRLVFDVAPSSSSVKYKAAREALQAALKKRAPPKFNPITPQQQTMRKRLRLPQR